MAARLISYDYQSMHSGYVTDNFNEDRNLFGQIPGEYGTGSLHNYKFRLGDLVIDMSTGDSHWLGSNGWV